MINYIYLSRLAVFGFVFGLLVDCNTSEYASREAAEEMYLNSVSLSNETSIELTFLTFSNSNADENISRAVRMHPSVLSSSAKIRAANASVDVVKSRKKTQSSLSLSGGFARDNGTTDPGLLVGMSLSRLLFDYGATSSSIKSYDMLSQAADLKMLLTADEVAVRALGAWSLLGTQRDVVKVFQRGLDLADPLVGQIENISTSGLADKSTALTAQRKYASLKMGLDDVKSKLIKSRTAFQEYFPGVDLVSVEELNYPTFQVEDYKVLETKMLKNSKKLKVAGLLIKSKELQIESTILGSNPTYSLSGSATAPAKDLKSDGIANLGFSANYTFNDGGKREAQTMALRGELASLTSDRKKENTAEKVNLELLLQSYSAATDRVEAILSMLELAKEVKETAKAQLISGRSKIEDVLNAEVMLAETQIDLIKTRAERQITSIQIDALVNGLINNLDL